VDAASEITLRNMARFVEMVVSGGIFFSGEKKDLETAVKRQI
jgi:hypothetical protein